MSSHGATSDVAIVGGGIVGLATARALLARSRLTVTVLEAETNVAGHQTGHNSGVVHSGLYYEPGSLKAKTCIEGRRALYRYCDSRGVEYRRCGKLVVAVKPEDIPGLEELERRGRANGLTGLERLGSDGIREREPSVAGIEALWVPATGVVDFGSVARAFAADIRAAGGTIHTSTRVRHVSHEMSGLAVVAGDVEIRCRHLVNCAGLQADRLARLCGCDPGLRILPFRGEYHELRSQARDLVNGLIYPVPDPRLPFLGIHLTRTLDDRRLAGPNAVLALARENYGRFGFSLRDTLDSISYPGLWKLASSYPRAAVAEVHRSVSRRAFLRAARLLVPDLGPGDLEWSGCGIRAQAVLPSGRLVDDFRLIEDERFTHVLNAPSPAATASISIGETIARRVTSRLDGASGEATSETVEPLHKS